MLTPVVAQHSGHAKSAWNLQSWSPEHESRHGMDEVSPPGSEGASDRAGGYEPATGIPLRADICDLWAIINIV